MTEARQFQRLATWAPSAREHLAKIDIGQDLPAVINKPFRMRELALKLRQILETDGGSAG